jgi:hypothetical protein
MPAVTGNDQDYQSNEKTGRSRGCESVSQFSINNVFSAQERRLVSTHFQPQGIKSVHNDQKFWINKRAPCAEFRPATRLAVQDRLVPSIFSFAHKPYPQEVPSSYLWTGTPTDDLLTVRALHKSKDVRVLHELGDASTKGLKYTDNSISRRFSNSAPRQEHACQACADSCGEIRGTRLADQLREVSINSSKGIGILGRMVGSLEKSKKSARRKNSYINRQDPPDASCQKNRTERLGKDSGTPKLCEFYSSTGEIELPSTSKFPQCNAKVLEVDICHSHQSERKSDMVVAQLPLRLADPPASIVTFSNDGRLRPCLGSPIRRSSSDWIVDQSRTKIALQSKRDACCFEGFRRSLSVPEQLFSTCPMRQQNGASLLTQSGWNKIEPPSGTNIPSVSNTGSISHPLELIPYSGKIQQRCRSSVQTASAPRVASPPRSNKKGICEVGCSPDRLVCISQSACSDQLCLDRSKRLECVVPRRLFTNLDVRSSLGVSTPIPNSESIMSSQPGNGCVSPSSPTMESRLLARGHQSARPCSSLRDTVPGQIPDRCHDRVTPSTSTGNGTRGMEMWGWSESLSDWCPNQIKLLEQSWRASTRKTYDIAWKKWVLWASSQGVNYKKPSGSDVAKYLSDLHLVHNLSYRTILLYKSVVSTLCNAEASGQLSSHILVKQVLKSIALQKPNSKNPPIWNVENLLSHLSKRNIDLESCFETSRHTAMLLLLCSGRRIHDLTLLNVDCKHFVQSDDFVTFWPEFGSKTDCADYRQSGWKLLYNPTCQNLNPVFWVNHTISILKNRRDIANIDSLFVTLRGEVKTASRTIISGWVKSIFKEAGITATPGSVRSAVASKNWFDNFPVDDILARGNWRSENTFSRYYRREVMPVTSNDVSINVSRLFKAID